LFICSEGGIGGYCGDLFTFSCGKADHDGYELVGNEYLFPGARWVTGIIEKGCAILAVLGRK
jgi:hypothetical protein